MADQSEEQCDVSVRPNFSQNSLTRHTPRRHRFAVGIDAAADGLPALRRFFDAEAWQTLPASIPQLFMRKVAEDQARVQSEELRSRNEELRALNQELTHTIAELSQLATTPTAMCCC